MANDAGLLFRVGIVEVDRDETLPRTLFKIFKNALVTRVLGNGQAERRWCGDHFAGLLHWQCSAVIS